MSKPRWKWFETPPPTGWTPAIGETVLLPPDKGTIGRLLSRGEVKAAGGGVFLVKACYGTKELKGYFALDRLRPWPYKFNEP